MTDLPAPATAPVPVATLDPADVALDRFLARVAALTPAQWGELDAIGQRMQGGGPAARWRRARRESAVAASMPLARDIFTVVQLAVDAALDLEDVIFGPPRRRARVAPTRRPTPRPASPSTPPALQRFLRASSELAELALAQPGGPGAAMECLSIALRAVWMRPTLPAAAFAEMYAPVEPVIPAASL